MPGNELDQAPTIFDPRSKQRKHGKAECIAEVWDALDTRTGMSRSRYIAVSSLQILLKCSASTALLVIKNQEYMNRQIQEGHDRPFRTLMLL